MSKGKLHLASDIKEKFNYTCEECGKGIVKETIFKSYRTKIRRNPFTVPEAKIGVCDKCGAKHFDAEETRTWDYLYRKKHRIPFLQGESVVYETESDIELTVRIPCANQTCNAFAVLRLMKGGSTTGNYHSKKYGYFDLRNEGFVCSACQKGYDKFFKKKGWHKTYNMLSLYHTLA
jgi:hypothetical protein